LSWFFFRRHTSYCSRECQVKAWREGHKTKCPNLEETTKQFEQMLAEADAAQNLERLRNFPLSYHTDSYIVERYFALPKGFMTESDYNPNTTNKLEGPSMPIFYANLERVVKGEWWFFGSPKKYTRRQSTELNWKMVPYFVALSHLLMFDIIPYAEKCNIDWSAVLDENPTTSSISCFFSPVLSMCVRGLGRMTSSQFLDIYENYAAIQVRICASRKQHKAKIIKEFRESAHK